MNRPDCERAAAAALRQLIETQGPLGWAEAEQGGVFMARALKDLPLERARLIKLGRGAVRSTISAHGPVTAYWVGSAAKRLMSQLKAEGVWRQLAATQQQERDQARAQAPAPTIGARS